MSTRFRRLPIALLALGLLAAACGNSDDDDDVAEDDTAPAETTTVAPDPGTDTGGEPTDTTTTAATDDGEETTGAGSFPTEFPTEFVALEDVPGVSDTEIAYALIGTEANNPLGTCIRACYSAGVEAYFNYVNGLGGIYGRELVIGENFDDELANNQLRSEEVIASGSAFGVFTATLIFSGSGPLFEARVPTYVWGIHANDQNNRDSIWGHIGQACPTCTNRVIPHLAQLVGATSAGLLGYGVSENSKQCAGAYRDSIEKYSSEIGGVTVGYFNDDLQFGLANGIAPEVTAMLEAGVDFIATCMDLNGMLTLAQELDRQGGQDVVMYHPNTYNLDFAREAGDLFAGDYMVPQFRPFEAAGGNPALAAFFEEMEALGEPPSELAMNGWLNADLAVRGLIEAGPEFDRESVIAATNAITDYSAGGLLVPIDWTRQHSAPVEGDPATDYVQECYAAVQFDGETFTPIGGEDTPWLCWSNETLDWSEPLATNFE